MKDIQLGKYLIFDKIAEGGFGEVYRAVESGSTIKTNRIAIIKIIKKSVSDKKDFKDAFINEVSSLFPKNHPNIAKILDFGEFDEKVYYATEYIFGKSLEEIIAKMKEKKIFIPLEIALSIIIDSCKALHYVNNFKDPLSLVTHGSVHRDISPDNILISSDGHVKVIDFGIVKSKTNLDETQPGGFKGKIAFAAPEYINNGEVSHLLDQYCLGAVFYELVTNKRLITKDTTGKMIEKIINADYEIPSRINPKIPKELEKVILKMLNREPKKRFKNFNVLQRYLTEFLYKTNPTFNSVDVEDFMSKYFLDELEKEGEKTRNAITGAWMRKGIREGTSRWEEP